MVNAIRVKFPNLTNSKTSHDSASGEKLVSCREGRTKKEMAMMRQKSCVDKIRTYSEGGGYKTAKYASGWFPYGEKRQTTFGLLII